jgi:hypothetical protein
MEAMGTETKAASEAVTSEAAMKATAKPAVESMASPKTTVEATAAVEPTVAPKSAVTSKPSSVTCGLARRNCEQER